MGKPAKVGAAALTPGLTPDEFNRMLNESFKMAIEEGKKAYQEGIKEGERRERERRSKEEKKRSVDPYKATEARLHAIPVLKAKAAKETRVLGDIKKCGLGRRSADFVRFTRSGMCLSLEDIEKAVIQDKLATIMADKHEINTIEKALKGIANDKYYRAIPAMYFEGLSDKQIAVELHCDETTAGKNRRRLVRRLAVWLYGAVAVAG